MKNFYHICLTAHSEVLLRSPEDVALTTNLSALAAYRSGTELLADSQMSTHLHENVFSENPGRFAKSQEISITKAFNSRHSRRGQLFDGEPFILQIHGPQHMQMALNYTLRQGLHHGQSETAFDYPWSTCNYLFQQERGVQEIKAAYKTRSDLRKFLPKNADFPDYWKADENGILLRNTFEQLSIVENWYGTAKNFTFSMMRKTSEEWLAEQNKDLNKEQIITLDLIEQGYSPEEISKMFAREGNSKLAFRGMSDMELCMLIDNQLIQRFKVDSVYCLTQKQKWNLAEELRHDFGIRSEKQISRCLAMRYMI